MAVKKIEHEVVYPDPAATRAPICVPPTVWGGLMSRNVCISIPNSRADKGGEDNA